MIRSGVNNGICSGGVIHKRTHMDSAKGSLCGVGRNWPTFGISGAFRAAFQIPETAFLCTPTDYASYSKDGSSARTRAATTRSNCASTRLRLSRVKLEYGILSSPIYIGLFSRLRAPPSIYKVVLEPSNFAPNLSCAALHIDDMETGHLRRLCTRQALDPIECDHLCL